MNSCNKEWIIRFILKRSRENGKKKSKGDCPYSNFQICNLQKSKREWKVKSKQKVAELKFIDDQRKVLQEILRAYVAYEIIELGNEEFDDFISFLNIDANFLRKANDIELVRFIKDKFDHYKSENPKN